MLQFGAQMYHKHRTVLVNDLYDNDYLSSELESVLHCFRSLDIAVYVSVSLGVLVYA